MLSRGQLQIEPVVRYYWGRFNQHVYAKLFCADPKSAKRQSSQHYFFALFGSAHTQKLLVKLK